MKEKIFFAIFVMLVLLLGFPSSVVDFDAYAQKEKISAEESEAYKKQQKNAKEKRETAKERKEQLEKQETEKQKKLAKKKVEQKEKYKAAKKEVKSKYDDIREDYKKKFDDLRDELKNKFRQLQTTQLVTQNTTALTSEITEDNILEFEEKRMMLQKLKQKLREQILEIKIRAHMETEDLQNFLEEENERKIKVKAKLHVLKLKFKDRIKEHQISESSYLEDNGVVGNHKVVICHIPPGNPENGHSIKISMNALPAHLAHGDTPFCNGEMPDDVTPPVITLEGDDPQIVVINTAYIEDGATAFDLIDGNVTNSIVIDASTVDVTTVGSYSVTYNVIDSSGNAASEVTRTVEIVDTMPPDGEQFTIEVTESIGIGAIATVVKE